MHCGTFPGKKTKGISRPDQQGVFFIRSLFDICVYGIAPSINSPERNDEREPVHTKTVNKVYIRYSCRVEAFRWHLS